MPRFFIDTSDQQTFVRDDLGLEFTDLEAARNEAVAALPEMARDVRLDGDTRTFLAIVRDDQDRTLLQASLTLSVVWLA